MKLHSKNFATPRAMLQQRVVHEVVDFLNQCEFTKIFYGDLNRSEYGWLRHIQTRIEYMLQNCAVVFGGDMNKCLKAYEKLLPQIKKLLLQ